MEQIDHQREMYPFLLPACPVPVRGYNPDTQTKRPRRCKRPGGGQRGRPLRYATGVFEARGTGSVPYSEPFALTTRAARFACRVVKAPLIGAEAASCGNLGL